MIRAAVFDGPGRPFRVAGLPRPALAEGEALVRVGMCTVCGSDLHTAAGRRPGPTPCVLGHEAVGVVVETGGPLADVDGGPVLPGDRVVWSVAASCGRCFFCRADLPQKCATLRKFGHEPQPTDAGPLGGLATHSHLRAGTAFVRVPGDVPDAAVAPAGCATATAMAALEAAWASGGRRPGAPPETVVVFGAGLLGLTACAAASARGATVVVCDVDDTRLSLAGRFGAAHAVTPAGVAEAARALTAGRGADAAVEASGSSAAAGLALDVLRTGGRAVWVGTVSPAAAVPVDPEAVVRKCLTLAGVHNYAPRHLRDAVRFLTACHAGFPFAELVSRAFPLEEVGGAFRAAEADRPVRVAVVP